MSEGSFQFSVVMLCCLQQTLDVEVNGGPISKAKADLYFVIITEIHKFLPKFEKKQNRL